MSANKSSLKLFVELSVMMFFLFFTWGAWYATMSTFMVDRGIASSISWAYSLAPLAAIVTPFFMGVFADRFINAEKLQGGLLILSGFAIIAAPSYAAPETSNTFLGLLLLHTLCFMPTLGLSNTICLKHLADQEREYPKVRVLATLGWIAAGLTISFVFKAEASPVQFYLAGAVAFGVGLYSFFLPKTPPQAKGKTLHLGELYGAATLRYFKKRSFAVFMFASLFAAVGMMPYWSLSSPFLNAAGIQRTGAFLSIGQVAELFVLAFALPVFIKRFGIKWTMIVGLLCWIARYVLFSAASCVSGSSTMVMITAGIVIHGFCYDFVFISGFLYVDKHVKEEVRAQAQGLLVVFTQGIGFLLSSQIFAGYVYEKTVGEVTNLADWQNFWFIPSVYLVVILALFCFFFREDRQETTS